MSILFVIICAVGSIYALWIFYLAVMSLKRARDAGIITKRAEIFGTPVLIIGLILDFVVNTVVMTVILLEIPKETTVTSRLKRHNKGPGWRKSVSTWIEPLLDPFDPSGDHI